MRHNQAFVSVPQVTLGYATDHATAQPDEIGSSMWHFLKLPFASQNVQANNRAHKHQTPKLVKAADLNKTTVESFQYAVYVALTEDKNHGVVAYLR